MADTPYFPMFSQIRDDTAERAFGIRPCISQIRAAAARLGKESDVVYISGTGSGKTLTFWMPMLYEKKSITILAGIPTANLTEENANAKTFREIKACQYCLIVVSPEL
ncbi:hypothetical protein M422DRAFT_268298 [Sphaerobolus stellatus SS14]|uniref:Unplaced genomic scaffold SPHSTscaffold_192, whole genome shotgun sequence n=1 Tax=Sphaerobolus stellatus (strain SS14) TaxID=990650 RepID=A0A0C9UYE5_SPHS4|nr:hypothetical protein M422DRAFT_268298 [Sphaerobolus stellatus SS14]